MTIHYHGTPLSPVSTFATMAGRSFCVSYAAPQDLRRAHEVGEGVMLDNGAFSFWRSGIETGRSYWTGYYEWAAPWLDYPTTWAVIPDVIGGSVEANDDLLAEWPLGDRGAPVWHMNEPVDRLLRLADEWPRVCIGSAGEYPNPGDANWMRRMDAAMNRLCGNGPVPVWLHMLRGLDVLDLGYPFASADSTNVAQNHKRNGPADKLAARLDAVQCQPRWSMRGIQTSLVA